MRKLRFEIDKGNENFLYWIELISKMYKINLRLKKELVTSEKF